ncbi:MAG TPA: DUF6250 domain-containing protein [Opitutales bacterium]|nr:DUF6250 domain-containing protein [Opitutales bacterium]
MRIKISQSFAFLAPGLALLICGCAHPATLSASLDPRFQVGETLFSDDFQRDDGLWVAELEKGGAVKIGGGRMEIEVPGGGSVWFRPELSSPVLIEYDATLLQGGGPHDRVSDLNCFWMAQDSRSPGDIFATRRTGKFTDYDQLRCYYVGQGGNTNTTTRFRRYIGVADNRPLLPENDLHDARFLLQPNVQQHLTLIACGRLIQYYRDGQKIFELTDPAPYTRGWFAIRTTQSHLTVENFFVRRLIPVAK